MYDPGREPLNSQPMPHTEPDPVLRSRIETAIGLLAPLLDLALAVGDRASRILGSADPERAPARISRHGEYAPRGLPPRQRARP